MKHPEGYPGGDIVISIFRYITWQKHRRKCLALHRAINRDNRDKSKGAFVWDQSGIRMIGIMQVNICLGAILIPE